MPFVNDFIDSFDTPAPDVVLGGEGLITADGSLASHLRVVIVGTSLISATLTAAVYGVTEIPGTSTLFARGRIGSEANVFGAAEINGTSTLFASGAMFVRGKAIINGTSSIVAGGRLSEANRTTLNVVLTVVPAGNAGFGDTISARIAADGVNYPIRSAVYNEPRDSAGVSLEVTLQKPADRAAILAASSFKFEIYTAGAWNTIFDVGRRSGGGFSFAWVEARPNDALSISTVGPVSDRLNKSPLENVTVYDSARETLHAADFPIIYDTDGQPHVQTLVAIAGLGLFDLLQYVFVTRLGFAGFQTDIPNYPIRRADFDRTGSYLAGIGPHVGVFDPIIFVKDNVVWLIDSTQKIPPGFATPYPLAGDDYRTAQLNETVSNADGYVVTYADAAEFDYSVDREIIDDPDISGTFGDANYTEIDRKRTFRDFYKVSNPFVPIRTEKVSETETTRTNVLGSFVQVGESVESVNLDSHGRLVSITKNVTGLIPDITTPSFPFITATLRNERTDFLYAPVLNAPGREILAKTTKVIRGIVVVDSENEHLGRPFKQSFVDGFRAGNLSDAQTLAYGPIATTIETVMQNERGQLEIRTRQTDYMTTPPSITNQTTDARAGDLSTNARGGAPQQIIVFRAGASRTDARLLPLSVGELPIKFAVPLARRRLANPTNRTGSVALKGLRLQFGRGFVFELFDRDGGSIGNYIIEGRSITLNELGTTSQNSTQNLDVSQV